MAVQRVSVASDGTLADGVTGGADASADGRGVGFYTDAVNLDPGDTNGAFDAYVRDLAAGTTEGVSVGDMGQFPAYGSDTPRGIPQPFLSADGRFVAFEAFADDLVPGDGNNANDVFVRDRLLDTTIRVTTDDAPRFGDARNLNNVGGISDDGAKILFSTRSTAYLADDANGAGGDLFVADRTNGTFDLVSLAPDGTQFNFALAASFSGDSISDDGRHVVFAAPSTSLGGNDYGTGLYLRDTVTGTTEPLPDNGGFQASFSADGRDVLITQDAREEGGPLLLLDRGTNALTPLLPDVDTFVNAAISGDGNVVAFESADPDLVPNDTNAVRDVFVLDRAQDTIVRVSLDELGRQAAGASNFAFPDLSFDGRTVTFASDASLVVDDATNGEFTASDVYAVILDAFAVADVATVTAGTPTTLDVLANDYDLDGDAPSLTGFITPAGATVVRDDNGTATDLSDDELTITPDAAYRGPLNLTYTVEDPTGNEGRAAVDLFVRGPGGADAFPELVEKQAIDPGLINGVDPDLLTGDGTSEFVVSFVSEVARFENSLGTYTVAENGEIVDSEFLFTNVDGARPGDEVSLGVLGDGERFNLFVLQDGFGRNEEISSGAILEDEYSLFFGDPFETVSVTSDDPGLRYGFNDGDFVFDRGLFGDALHATSYITDARRNPLNTGGELQALSGFDEAGRLLIGFEDKTRAAGGSDDDFNDVVVAIEKRDPTTGATIAFGDGDAMFG